MFFGTIDPASNRATWSESFELIDSETGDPISLSAVDEITLEVRDMESHGAVLSGSYTGGEIVIVGAATDGTFQWRFEAAQMRGLCARTYEVGVTIESDDDTVQLLIGYLPVLDGIVS